MNDKKNIQPIKKLTGKQWAEELFINISDPLGWFSKDDFDNELITKSEFCNRAANSKLVIQEGKSRRDMAKFRESLNNKNEKKTSF